MSNNQIECVTHGDRRAAYVCSHTMTSLRDGEARGFIWSHDDGCINAWCKVCGKILEDAGGSWNEEAEAHTQIELICEACALRVAALNGVEVLE